MRWSLIAAFLLVSVARCAGGQPVAHDRLLGLGIGGPYKVVAADFTGDGKLDLAIGYHAVGLVTIEQGDGAGNFQRIGHIDVPLAEPSQIGGIYNVALGHIDNDGLPDLVLTVHGSPPADWKDKDLPADVLQSGWAGAVIVAHNRGQGRFDKVAEYPVQSHATGVALRDLDRDGRADLLYTARGTGYRGDVKIGTLHLRRGLEGLKFGDPIQLAAGPSAYFVETGDFNGDGLFDMAVPNEHGVNVQRWLNPGRDLFAKPDAIQRLTLETVPIPNQRSHAINHVRAADVDRDGKLDLLTANLGTSTVSKFLGNGDGTFRTAAPFDAGKDGAWIDIGDLNQDGAADFVMTHWTGDFLSVFMNDGRGNFAPRKDYQTGSGNYGVTLADLDADGKLDCVTANYRDKTISVLKGVGNGTFQPAVTTSKALHRVNGEWVVHVP